jgi:hypothetical protein
MLDIQMGLSLRMHSSYFISFRQCCQQTADDSGNFVLHRILLPQIRIAITERRTIGKSPGTEFQLSISASHRGGMAEAAPCASRGSGYPCSVSVPDSALECRSLRRTSSS